MQDYVEHDEGGRELKAIVQLVDTYGPDRILSAVGRLSPEGKAKVTVPTAHKATGRVDFRTHRSGLQRPLRRRTTASSGCSATARPV
ncbi:hypothetical protein [Streptomyces sp. CT34]|uniref:hypothetical protein n=1 Tax=Streptomyces sp. CT34 TaxID=1553907 RepID=UPI0005BA37C7|nr:hypothetical protein [Streptomyces sp. CT34]